MSSRSISVPAFAKINWSLRVLGKRADGYHEVDTFLQTISLHDTVTVEHTDQDDLRLWCDDSSIPAGETNLAWRAAAKFRERFSTERGLRIRLEKRIPAEAGLGGGSSDAAATLVALARLSELDTQSEDLVQIAADLGSDVPFFLHGGTARGTGRGSVVEPLADAPEQPLLVIKPNARVSTATAYNALNRPALTSSNSKPILFRSQASDVSASFDWHALHNDFEAVVFKLEPEIERVKNALLKCGAGAALLAGSGSAVFGIFENQDAQERAIQAMELETGWRAFPCKTVERGRYQEALSDFRRASAVE